MCSIIFGWRFTAHTLLLVLVTVNICAFAAEDPYGILGVPRSASSNDIKAAYKKLAKEWHPDKNPDPSAQDRFVKINEAYQILTDPSRKEQYDRFGTTNEQQQQTGGQPFSSQHGFFREFHRGPFGSHSFFFDDLPFGSFFNGGREQQNVKLLTMRAYENIVKPDSYHKLFLIAVFGDFCFECMRLQPVWEAASESLESLGVGTYEVHYESSRDLVAALGVGGYPAIVAVAFGRSVKFKDRHVSETTLRNFLETLLPSSLVDTIGDGAKDFFEQSFKDNKPQCVLFSHRPEPPLLFKLVALEYRRKVKFAYVNLKDYRTAYLKKKYRVDEQLPTVIMLKEEPSNPVVVMSGSSLKRGVLRQAVTQNLYLEVPRLSSQEIFDELCPAASRRPEQWICAILVVGDLVTFSKPLYHLRVLARDPLWLSLRVRFLYVFQKEQGQFLKNFGSPPESGPCSDSESALKVLLLRRSSARHGSFRWLDSGWCPSGSSSWALQSLTEELARGRITFDSHVEFVNIVDEHRQGVVWDVMEYIYGIVQRVLDTFDSPNTSGAAWVILVLLVIFVISFSLPMVSDFMKAEPSLPRHVDPDTSMTVLGLKMLGRHNVKQCLHQAPMGQMLLVVLLDAVTADEVAASPITQAYAEVIYNFSGNPNYTFMWVSIPEHLNWCAEIMAVRQFGEMTPGTVLAMNGFRKYLHIFKPGASLDAERAKSSANFVGFEDSADDSGDDQPSEIVNSKRIARQLRSELPQWLERLFEGTLKAKQKVDSWPPMDA